MVIPPVVSLVVLALVLAVILPVVLAVLLLVALAVLLPVALAVLLPVALAVVLAVALCRLGLRIPVLAPIGKTSRWRLLLVKPTKLCGFFLSDFVADGNFRKATGER